MTTTASFSFVSTPEGISEDVKNIVIPADAAPTLTLNLGVPQLIKTIEFFLENVESLVVKVLSEDAQVVLEKSLDITTDVSHFYVLCHIMSIFEFSFPILISV